jgi:hypothetical protein
MQPMQDENMTDETNITHVAHPGRTQRAGVLITLIAVVGAVAIMDIVAEMVVDLARLRNEDDY